jgi:acetyltransferase
MHKTEVGGVYLNARDADEVAAAYRQITDSVARKAPGAPINGVLVQEMASNGVELIIGIHRDRQFGPVILCGLGGVLAELLSDVALRLCPLGRADAEAMLSELKGARLLGGFRGAAARDLKGAAAALVNLSALANDFADEIESIDINPLMVFAEGEGVKAVDALIILRNPPETVR